MLATLFNIPKNKQGLTVFSFANADSHKSIVNAILSTYNILLPVYLLDPMDPTERSSWFTLHQQMHDDMNQILGQQGNDLTDVDLKKPDQIASWIWIHATEHRNAENTLEIR